MENLINYLYDKPEVNQFINILKSCKDLDIIKTRSQIKIISGACKFWQLQYCMLYLIYKKNFSLIKDSKFLYDYCKYYLYMIRPQSPPTIINKLIIYSELIDPGINFRTYREFGNNFLKFGNRQNNYYCCIYAIDKRYNTYLTNGIFHYFTLILNDDNEEKFEFYITSSYGSDHVCIPNETFKLENLNELFLFGESLKYIHYDSDKEIKDNSINIFKYFMTKYFLSGGIPIKYDKDEIEENPSLRFKMIQPKEGLEKELSFYLDNAILEFDIAVITNYEDLVKSSIIERHSM
jgi:hypothetical protein